jgi:DNA-binding protein YbaB
MDANAALITDLTQRMEALRAKTYVGRDDNALVEATVDGDGGVVEITFAQTISRHDAKEVADAIRAAVDAAQQSLATALAQLAQEAEQWQTPT